MFMALTGTGVVSAELLEPIVTTVMANITAVLPIGLTIMGAMVGVGLIPRLIYKFL